MERRKKTDIELEHDTWQRFERAVAIVAKSPPQHRVKRKKSKRAARKKKILGRGG